MNSNPASQRPRERRRFASSSTPNRVKSITIPYSIVALAQPLFARLRKFDFSRIFTAYPRTQDRRRIRLKSNLQHITSLLLTTLLLSSPPLPAQDQREIWVPTTHLEAVLKKMPKAVLLTPEQYEQLREEFQQTTTDPDKDKIPPPVSAVIRSAEYRGTVQAESDVVFVEVTYEIECFTDEWTEVPLLLPREHLGYVVIDSDTALRVTPPTKKKKATPPLLLTHGKGTHRVEANYHIPITRLPNGNLIKIKSPGVPASLNLSLPDSSDLESELPFVRKPGSATFALPSERDSEHEIRWSAKKVAAIPGAAVFQSCSYLYSLDSTSLQADLAMVINSALTDLPTHFDIEISKAFRVLSVEGEELLRWTREANGTVSVDLVPGDRDATDIRLRVERDVPDFDAETPDVELALPIATVQGIHRASGTMTLVGSDDIRVKRIATGPLTIPIPDDAEGPAVNLPNYIASFRFPVSTEAPAVTLSKIQSRYKAQLDTLISFEREAINLTRTLTVLPLEGMLFSLATQLSPEEEILSITAAGDDKQSGFDWTADDDNRVLLTWDSGLTSGSPATLTIETRRDPEGWFALGNEPMDLAFSATEIEDVEAVSGYLAVAFDESFQVETLDTTGLESRDARTTPVSGTLAWFRLDEFELSLAARRRAPELEASVVSYALPLANTVEIKGQIDLDIRFSGIEELAVTFPEDVAPLVRFDSPLIAEQTLGDDNSTWTLRFHQERKGTAQIRFSLILPFEAKADPSTGIRKEGTFGVALPRIGIPAAKRIRGDWVMEANTDTELDFRAEGLDRVDSLQVPTVAGYQPRHRIIAAFRYRGDEWSLELNGTRHPHSEVVTAVVDSLQLDTVVSVDGADRHQAQLAMRSTGEQFLDLQLPPEAIVWTLLVDDETVKPVRAGEDTLRVQLPAHEDANQQIRIHLIYQTPGKEWRGSGKEKLIPIRLADRIPVMRTQWFLHLPEGYDYQKFKTNLGQEFEVVDRLLLGEAAKKFGDELGNVGGFLMADTGAEYTKSDVAMPAPTSEGARVSDDRLEREKSRAEFLSEVATGWESPAAISQSALRAEELLRDEAITQIRANEERLKRIILPSVEFDDTPLKDALNFLTQRSVELDTIESDPADKGISIILDAGQDLPAAPTGGGEGFGFEGAGAGNDSGGVGDTPITLRLTNVPLSEALRYTTSLAQLKYRVEPEGISVVPLSTPDQDLYTNVYNVPPDFLSAGNIGGGGGAAAADPFGTDVEAGGGVLGGRKTAKEILESVGITFSTGASAVYDAETEQLIVRNTLDQMELVEAYESSLNRKPDQNSTGRTIANDPSEIILPPDTTTTQIRMSESKLTSIVIPSIEFDETPLRDALDFLVQRSVELDTNEPDPSRKGINIVMSYRGLGDTPISLRLSNVSLAEALRYTTSLAQLKYKVESNAVVVVPISTPDQDLFTNVYIVPPTFLSTDKVGGSGGAAAADPFAAPVEAGDGILGARRSAKGILEEAGISFGTGSSAIYNAATGQLIVRNTQDQMELVEANIQSSYAQIGHGGISAKGNQRGTIRVDGGISSPHDGKDVEDKVPFLGDLPQIGRLFESSEKIGNQNEKLLRELSFDDVDLNGQTLEEAADLLNKKLAEAASDQYPAARGLNITLSDGDGATPEQSDPLDFKLGKITVLEALDKLTGATNTHYRVTASGILIAPADIPLEPMESVFIPLPSSKFLTINAQGESKQTHARQVLLAAGIEFPPGSSAAYNPVSGRLAVKNTRENLEAIVSMYADDIAGAHSASDGDKDKDRFAKEFLGGATDLRGFDYRDIGKRPLKFALPESGRSYRFSGLYAPDELSFRFVNWERQIRFAWIWILVGGLVFWFVAWRKLGQPVFLGIAGIIALTFLPLLVTTSLSAFCNALLIGWIAAMVLALIVHISRKVARHES